MARENVRKHRGSVRVVVIQYRIMGEHWVAWNGNASEEERLFLDEDSWQWSNLI